jgi:hypothetical protein
MKHYIGIGLQLVVLAALPAIVIGQLAYNFHLLVMPISLLIGIIVFLIGYKLRES